MTFVPCTKMHRGKLRLSIVNKISTQRIPYSTINHYGRWIAWEALKQSLWHWNITQIWERSRVETVCYKSYWRSCCFCLAFEGIFTAFTTAQRPDHVNYLPYKPFQELLSARSARKMPLQIKPKHILMTFVIYYQALECNRVNMQ